MAQRYNISVFLFSLLIAVLTSCSKHLYPSESSITVFYPSPPDTARIQFLKRYGNSLDFTGRQKKFKTFVAGEENALPFIKPYGLAIHENKLFIADAGVAGLEISDLDKKTFEYFIPEGRGKLSLPINCFIDEGGDLYVSDVVRRQVVIFNELLEYKGEIGGDENFKPADVVVFGDTILITDPKNNRINIYDKTSRRLLSTLPEDAVEGDVDWLFNPLNICVADGKIYITDFGDSRVKIFSMKGKYLNSIGSYGRGLGQFVRPKGIAVDRELNLYAVDAGFNNVQIFNKEGQLLMYFGGPYNGPGDMYLPAKVVIDYETVSYFEKYVDPAYELKYLIYVVNQYGP
ncbi:MAG: 6-bladed beta-propeller, partial [Bacteroidota bacterium]